MSRSGTSNRMHRGYGPPNGELSIRFGATIPGRSVNGIKAAVDFACPDDFANESADACERVFFDGYWSCARACTTT